jgi:hypothetical protein
MFPPESTATVLPLGSATPFSNAATVAAPDGSARPRAGAASMSAKLMGLGSVPLPVRPIPCVCTVGWPLHQGTDTIWIRSQPGVVS